MFNFFKNHSFSPKITVKTKKLPKLPMCVILYNKLTLSLNERENIIILFTIVTLYASTCIPLENRRTRNPSTRQLYLCSEEQCILLVHTSRPAAVVVVVTTSANCDS